MRRRRHTTHVTAPMLATERIGRVLATGALALLGVTWRLWTPQNVFPRVPAFELVTTWPRELVDAIDWTALGVCIAGLVYLLLLPKRGLLAQLAALVVTIGFVALVALDQHRLQPWVVHIALGLLLANYPHPERRIDYLRWFTASIYVYSAIGKFDAQFLHTVGQDFVGTLLSQIGMDIRLLSDQARFWLAAGLPIAELVVGCGLALRRTRVTAAIAAIIMHLLLLSALGPWGLQHAWGVLVWNVLFIALDVLLFLWPASARRAARDRGQLSTAESNSRASSPVRFGWIEGLLIVAMIAPLGERVGLVDHWLGWALYAPHSSRARVEVSAAAVARLPAAAEPFVSSEREDEVIWREVHIDRWSLATLGAPVYPQQRFQLGVARALAEFVGQREIRVHLLSPADRWSGDRSVRTLDSREELDAAAASFWFNTKPIFTPTP